MEIINFIGEGTVIPGVGGKSITVRRLALAAHSPVKVTVVGTSLAPLVVDIKVKNFESLCPFTLAPGAGLVLRSDKADVKVAGYADVDQE